MPGCTASRLEAVLRPSRDSGILDCPRKAAPSSQQKLSPGWRCSLFGERTSPGCLLEGDREAASRVAGGDRKGVSIFRFGTQLPLLKGGWKGETGRHRGLSLAKHLQTETFDCLTLSGRCCATPLCRTLSPLAGVTIRVHFVGIILYLGGHG